MGAGSWASRQHSVPSQSLDSSLDCTDILPSRRSCQLVPETGVAAEVVMMEVITTTMWLEGIRAGKLPLWIFGGLRYKNLHLLGKF